MKHSDFLPPDKCLLCDNKSLTNHLELQDYFLTGEYFNIIHCPNCEIMFTWPRPETDKLPAYYKSEEYISHSNKKSDLQSRIYQRVRNYTIGKKIKLIKKFTSGKHILDIGCATGEFLNQCKKQGFVTMGVEPDKGARENAHTQYGLSVFENDYLDRAPDASYDVITLWHVLEHVEDPEERMTQIYRLLKPDGYAFIALPNPSSYDATFYGKFWAAWDVPRHLFHYNKKSFQRLAEKSGFKIADIKPMIFDSYYISLLSEKYMKRSLSIVRAVFRGAFSNFTARTGKKEFSSQIFVLRKV